MPELIMKRVQSTALMMTGGDGTECTREVVWSCLHPELVTWCENNRTDVPDDKEQFHRSSSAQVSQALRRKWKCLLQKWKTPVGTSFPFALHKTTFYGTTQLRVSGATLAQDVRVPSSGESIELAMRPYLIPLEILNVRGASGKGFGAEGQALWFHGSAQTGTFFWLCASQKSDHSCPEQVTSQSAPCKKKEKTFKTKSQHEKHFFAHHCFNVGLRGR